MEQIHLSYPVISSEFISIDQKTICGTIKAILKVRPNYFNMQRYLKLIFKGIKRLNQQRIIYMLVAVGFLVVLVRNQSEANKTNSAAAQQIFLYDNAIDTKTDSLITYALSMKGIPYAYEGKSLNGFDCSGFIYFVFNKFGIEIPAGSANQFLEGTPVDESNLAKGDLVFFKGYENDSDRVGHVGIVFSTEDEIFFVHSSSGGGGRGITTNSLEHPQYRARFLGARRVISTL
ncbi:Cell wall-associated hydrolase, NlpC family [Rhodonellum ikkaensis]|nr:Cell wall-associated hydrolase, NlpC family [Rhodonellum ikkaensis]